MAFGGITCGSRGFCIKKKAGRNFTHFHRRRSVKLVCSIRAQNRTLKRRRNVQRSTIRCDIASIKRYIQQQAQPPAFYFSLPSKRQKCEKTNSIAIVPSLPSKSLPWPEYPSSLSIHTDNNTQDEPSAQRVFALAFRRATPWFEKRFESTKRCCR